MMNEIFNYKVPEFENPLCAETGFGDLFFPETRSENRIFTPQAKKICQACSHRIECLQFAIDENIHDGIWGGLSSRDRIKFIPRTGSGKASSDRGERANKYREQGFSYEWIASRLEMSPGAVQQAVSRYRKKMIDEALGV